VIQNPNQNLLSDDVSIIAIEIELEFVPYFAPGRAPYRPPLWSSSQSFWLQIQRSRVRFPALPDFLRSSGSGMEDYLKEK
jgi:hypothetical protein